MKDIRILIADEDKEIRNLLKIYLERELYMVDNSNQLLEADAETNFIFGIKALVFQNMIYKTYLSECTEANNQETLHLVVAVSGFLFPKRSLRKTVDIYGLKVLHGNELLLAFLFQNTILLRNS